MISESYSKKRKLADKTPRAAQGGEIQGTWTATVRDVEGVLHGTLTVPVAEEPVDLGALLDEPEPDPE
jgi:hypothetical protein